MPAVWCAVHGTLVESACLCMMVVVVVVVGMAAARAVHMGSAHIAWFLLAGLHLSGGLPWTALWLALCRGRWALCSKLMWRAGDTLFAVRAAVGAACATVTLPWSAGEQPSYAGPCWIRAAVVRLRVHWQSGSTCEVLCLWGRGMRPSLLGGLAHTTTHLQPQLLQREPARPAARPSIRCTADALGGCQV